MQIEKELNEICKDVLEVLENHLIGKEKDKETQEEGKDKSEKKHDSESRVFYFKM